MGTRARIFEVLRSRRGQLWGLGVLSCAVIQLLTSGGETAGAFVTNAQAESAGGFGRAFGGFPWLLRQMVGVLGWLDVVLPTPVYVTWLTLLGFVVLMALGWASRRMLAILVGLVAVVVFAPTAILMVTYFQGRYVLPVAVGVPLVAGYTLAERAPEQLMPRRLLAICLGVLAALHLVAFHQHLRRYAVGAAGDWWYFPDAGWDPPLASAAVLTVVYALLIGALSAWFYALGRPSTSGMRRTAEDVSVAPRTHDSRPIRPCRALPHGAKQPTIAQPRASSRPATEPSISRAQGNLLRDPCGGRGSRGVRRHQARTTSRSVRRPASLRAESAGSRGTAGSSPSCRW